MSNKCKTNSLYGLLAICLAAFVLLGFHPGMHLDMFDYCYEICDNGLDDDGDGLIDMDDPDCDVIDYGCSIIKTQKDSSDFNPLLKCQYSHPGIAPYASPMFADVDNDGQVEVVALTYQNPAGFAVINADNCVEEQVIDVNGDVDAKEGGLALGDVDLDGYVDIFIGVGNRIRRYEYDPGLGSIVLVWETASAAATGRRIHLDILDLNQDGVPEIIPNVGFLVNSVTGYVYAGQIPLIDDEGKGLFAFSADADPGNAPAGEGNVELIRGTEIHRFNFITETWVLVRSLSAYNWITTAAVSIADIDNDCDVDAIVTNYDDGMLLAWDLQTDAMVGGNTAFNYPSELGSRINITNIDSDPFPEFVWTGQFRMMAMDDLINGNGIGSLLWVTTTSDFSGHTQITSFDFDFDGQSEIVYRDETRLRIFRGKGTGAVTNGYPSGPLVLLDTGDSPATCVSGTGMEYPTIGDVDGDDEAEIVISCEDHISIYESRDFAWGNATKIWNTQAYNVVNVNQDGSIPAVLDENYLTFNNFLSQINPDADDGPEIIPIPDLSITLNAVDNECSPFYDLMITVCNQGDTTVMNSVPLAIYLGDPTSNATLVDTIILNLNIDNGNCVDLTFSGVDLPLTGGTISTVINDDGQQVLPYILDGEANGGLFPVTNQFECDYTNNIASFNYLGPSPIDTSFTLDLCPLDTFYVGTNYYTGAGSYSDTLTSALGCDSILNFTISDLGGPQGALQDSFCLGSDYNFNGTLISNPGIYLDTIPAPNGCDSIVTLTLSDINAVTGSLMDSICPGGNYDFNGTIVTGIGIYKDTVNSILTGCDSIITLELVALSAVQGSALDSICPGSDYNFNGTIINNPGVYKDTVSSLLTGCDSIVTLTLAPISAVSGSALDSICPGADYDFNGTIVTGIGTYYDTITSQLTGCDSIVTLNLMAIEAVSGMATDSICPGADYNFNGTIVTGVGIYNDTITSQMTGCDSIVTLSLMAIDAVSGTAKDSICPGADYDFNGTLVTGAGSYIDTVTSLLTGCDSIVQLTLTAINASYGTSQDSICPESDYNFNGTMVNGAGTYRDTLNSLLTGCDSIVTLTLRDINPRLETVFDEFCSGTSYDFNGISLNSTGVYFDTLNSIATGCDSIVRLDLLQAALPFVETSDSICMGDSLFCSGEWVSTPGTYIDTVAAINSCDTIVSCRVIVIPEAPVEVENDIICAGESTVLSATGGDGTYQWSPNTGLSCQDCPNPIASPMETTTYTVSSGGCRGGTVSYDVTLFVQNLPSEVYAGEDTTVVEGDPVSLVAMGDAISYDWYEGEILVCKDCVEFTTVVVDDTEFTLVGNTYNDCFVEDYIKIYTQSECVEEFVELPNIITPNFDGANDTFYAQLRNPDLFKRLTIYNRWGEVVFETFNSRDRWDGFFEGKSLDPAVFVYVLELQCSDGELKRIHGNVTLIH